MTSQMPTPDARPREFVSWRRDRWMFADGGVSILMYHKISVTPLNTNIPGLYVSPARFERQMNELIRAGLPALGYGDALGVIEEGGSGFCVSFDDGFCNVFEHALPVLQARGLRAIQFIVAGHIGGEDEWDHAIGEPPHRLMDETQIRAWLAAGHEIGSHTMTHPRLTTLDRGQARREIVESKQRLEDRFGIPIRHFCYPYGDHDDGIRDLVAQAGYVTAPTVDFGSNRRGAEAWCLRRIMACNPPSPVRSLARKLSRLTGEALRAPATP